VEAGWGGHDHAGPRRAAVEIGDEGTGLGGDQAPRSHVPQVETALVERVEAGTAHRAEVERRAAHAPYIADVGQDLREHPALAATAGGVVREAGADQRDGEVAPAGHPQRHVVTPRAVAPHGAEDLTERRIGDDPDDRSAVHDRGDRHRIAGVVVEVVRGAVDRVDAPPHAARAGDRGALLAEHAVVGTGVEQAGDDLLLGPEVHGRDHVGGGGLGARARRARVAGPGELVADVLGDPERQPEQLAELQMRVEVTIDGRVHRHRDQATAGVGTIRRVLVDLRSDTVTRPTAAMRRAMADAEVGDDGYGEDPTVCALEERFAALMGKEAAVFVPSGTMANQIALCLLARPGTAVAVGRRAHVVLHEMGASARNGLYQFHTLADPCGVLAAGEIRLAVESAEHHHIALSAVATENTAMAACGAAVGVDALRAITAVGLPVHMDGARLFNAAIATGVSTEAYAATATTVMCCLSKGLAAPVGSVLALPAALEDQARVERKRLGGAMRQAGVLAAAGLVALDTMVDRLAEDHARAARLADAVLEQWPDSMPEPYGGTNLVVFRPPDAGALLAHLDARGVAAGTIAPGVVRFAVHHDVDDAGIARTIGALREFGGG
jgi:threonine aldolase